MFILFIDNFLFVSQWCMKLAKGNKPLVNMMSYANSTKANFEKRNKNRKVSKTNLKIFRCNLSIG